MTVGMEWLAIAPPVVGLFTGILCLFFWDKLCTQRILQLLGAMAHFGFSFALVIAVDAHGPLVARMGGWAAPFGIVYVADLFSALLLLVTSILWFAIALYNFKGGIDKARERFAYHPLAAFLIFGVSGAFVTGDIFHLYVCFEILLMASFVLMVLGNEKEQLSGALKYLVINLISSLFFLTAVGLLYAQVGTLNFADLSVKLSSFDVLPPSLTMVAHLLLVAFGVKAGLFPLFYWLPASYHNPPIPVIALFAGLLTKVGLYSLIRVFTFIFPHSGTSTFHWIWWLSVLTMIVGVIGAVSKMSIRRILSVHIISQVGYVTLGLALKSPVAIAAAIYYMVHNMFAKTNLFLISGVVESESGTDYLKKTGGLFKSHLWLSVLFLVSALGLAGIPPLSGFFAKLFLVKAAIAQDELWSVAAALGVSVFTLFSMIKIWNYAFWKNPPADGVSDAEAKKAIQPSFARSIFTPQMISVTLLAGFVLGMGVFAGPLWELSLKAANGLTDTKAYVDAVLPYQGEIYR